MNLGSDNPIGPRLEQLNNIADRLNAEKAFELRSGVIELVYKAASAFIQEDADTLRNDEDVDTELESDELPISSRIVNLDFLAGPGLILKEYVDAISYQLVRSKDRAPGETFGADRITMYIPVDEEFQLGLEPSELPPLDEIAEIYVRLEKDKGDETQVTRYAISRETVYRYVTAVDPDSEAEQDEIIDQGIHYMQTETQVSHMNMLAQLLEDHRNFKIQHQTNSSI